MNSPLAQAKSRSLLPAGIILVLIGLLGGVKAYYQHRPSSPARDGFIERTAILGGIEERVNVPEFSGGNLTAILGGFSLDLRGVQTQHDPIRLYVTAICGGGEIRVPEGWTVSVQARTIAGGVEQKLRTSSGNDPEDRKEDSDASHAKAEGEDGPAGSSRASVVIVRKDSDGRGKAQAASTSKHHLVIEGLLLCGGLEIKH